MRRHRLARDHPVALALVELARGVVAFGDGEARLGDALLGGERVDDAQEPRAEPLPALLGRDRQGVQMPLARRLALQPDQRMHQRRRVRQIDLPGVVDAAEQERADAPVVLGDDGVLVA